jgi:hypothetical protein
MKNFKSFLAGFNIRNFPLFLQDEAGAGFGF